MKYMLLLCCLTCFAICCEMEMFWWHGIIDFASGEVLDFGLTVQSSPTLRIGVWAYTVSEDCLNVSLKAAINILFICL